MDQALFEQLAMPIFDQLYNHACWLAGDRSDGEDLVQETYAKAIKGFASFTEGTNLRAWMFRILRNTFLNSRSGLAARMTEYFDDENIGSDESVRHDVTPELLLLRGESKETVFAALDSLPSMHREIIMLSEVEEMPYREIGQILDLPIGTVMSRLSRARAGLRKVLSAKLERMQ
jgi:RNA polymerase sigma-70 factor (ECF subfamily)